MPSQDALFGFFAQYNLKIWPLQIGGYGLCLVVLFFAAKRSKYSDHIIAALLAMVWLWLGVMFWLPAGSVFELAYLAAALTFIQAGLFLIGAAQPGVTFRVGRDPYSLAGLALIVYAIILYPLVGLAQGHTYPTSLTIGAFPCPTTIFTLGLFLCTANRVPKHLLIAPGLLALTGLSGVFVGIWEDLGLFVAGVVALALLGYRDRAMLSSEALRSVG